MENIANWKDKHVFSDLNILTCLRDFTSVESLEEMLNITGHNKIMVQKITLNIIFPHLKNRLNIDFMEKRHSSYCESEAACYLYFPRCMYIELLFSRCLGDFILKIQPFPILSLWGLFWCQLRHVFSSSAPIWHLCDSCATVGGEAQ